MVVVVVLGVIFMILDRSITYFRPRCLRCSRLYSIGDWTHKIDPWNLLLVVVGCCARSHKGHIHLTSRENPLT